MSVKVARLGLALVKGLSWSTPHSMQVSASGVAHDRSWSPVTAGLQCLKATDFASLVGLRVTSQDLPGPADICFDGKPQTVTYYGQPVQARLYRGALAKTLTEATGLEVLLAQRAAGGFVWSSAVSMLLRSELAVLPGDVDRYRANIVIDDLASPLVLPVGTRLQVGEVTLEVERELERCVLINHNPVTGQHDASLLRKLRPGALLGYGCRVLFDGKITLGDPAGYAADRA